MRRSNHPIRRGVALAIGVAVSAALVLSGAEAATASAATPASAAAPSASAAAHAPAAANAAAASMSDDSDLPVFTSTGEIVDPFDDSLPHNPNHEFIFPSLFHAGEYLEDPLAEWYIYYAPHDAPGGINLMYSDSLDGPWTQYEQSPVISNDWQPNYSVSHVSSPDAFWNADENQLFLYFHGENTVSRYATSTDGVHFSYGGPVVSTADVDAAQPGRHALETSYARVFTMPDDSTGYRYGMFFMINYSDDIRHIGEALSHDGRNWDVQPQPIVDPGDAEGANVSGADLWQWDGQYYIIYGSTVGTIFARTINPQLTHTGEPHPLFVPNPSPPQAGRAASPQIITYQGTTHMFYEYGERSHTTIGHAVLDPNGHRDPLNTHPEDPLYAQCTAPGSDEFTGDSLDTGLWNDIVRSDLDRHTVSDGALHVPTYTGNSTSSPLILQPVPSGPWEVTTKLTLNPETNFQQAGVIVRRDDANSARVDLSHVDEGKRIDFVWRHNNKDRNNKWTMEDAVMAPAALGDSIWLRMTSNGDYLTASYSVDGATFVNLGRSITMADLAPTEIGPFAYRGGESTPELTADFDWIRFTPNAEQLAACAAATDPGDGGGDGSGDDGSGDGDHTATVALSASTVAAGDVLGVTGTGFDAGELVDVSLHSSTVTLATLTADPDGAVAGSVTIPASTQSGSHSIVLTGATSGATASAALIVRAAATDASAHESSALAETGSDPFGALALAAIAIAIGLAGVLVATRRPRSAK